MKKALLRALLEPVAALKQLEENGDYTARPALLEEQKSLPWQAVWRCTASVTMHLRAASGWITCGRMRKRFLPLVSKHRPAARCLPGLQIRPCRVSVTPPGIFKGTTVCRPSPPPVRPGMIKATSDARLKGWDERNGGNLTLRRTTRISSHLPPISTRSRAISP